MEEKRASGFSSVSRDGVPVAPGSRLRVEGLLASLCLQEEGAFGREAEISYTFRSPEFQADREKSVKR